MFALKIAILFLALIGVLIAIQRLNGSSMQVAFDAIGVQADGQHAPGLHPAGRSLAPGDERFNLCPTRIHSIAWKSGPRIEENRDGLRMHWMASDGPPQAALQPREIAYLEVEKWLSAHCQIAVRPVVKSRESEDGGRSTFSPFLAVSYIDGSNLEIEQIEQIEQTSDASRYRFTAFAAGATPTATPTVDPRTLESPDLRQALGELEKIAQFERR